ncbi:MAG: FMN-binding protein, partial [bacterium]|nr:FMN-binding protein [bacterium]
MQNTTPKKQLPAYAVLAIIALVAALVLGLTHFVTAEPIARHQREALNKAFGTVMPLPEGGSYQQITEGLEGYDVSSLYSARDAQGNVVGYCVTASKKGYGGPVAVTLGVDAQGKVTGCVVGDTSFAESAGFGTRALEEPFREQFIGLDAAMGGTIEKLTGATVTSTAVLGATNEALRTVSEVVLGKPVDGGNLVSFGVKQAPQVDLSTLVPGGTMKGSAEGYGGESVQVTITLDDACLIATVKVDASTQTPGIGQRCATDEGFLNSFVGKSLPVEVDVLSGATITSQAVMDAINGAEAAEPEAQAVMPVADVVASDDHATLGLYEDGTAQVSAAEGFTGTVNVAVNVVEGKVQGGTVSSALPTAEPLPENALTGSAPGFNDDPVSVVVTLNADGTIASLTVDASNQMAGIGAVCEKEEFTSQFIGKTGPFSVDNIDVCSGATYTSKGVIEAVNSVLPAAETSAPVASEAAALTGSAPGFNDDPVSVVV